MPDAVGGINPVLEALKSRSRALEKLYLARGRSGPKVDEILDLSRRAGVRAERVDRFLLDKWFKGAGHQGVLAYFGPYPYQDLEDILPRAADPALVVILDRIQDPMNVGSIIRSAESAGACGLILPKDGAAPVTAAVLKAAAGAAEHLPIARVTNLARTIDRLKKEGFWVMGLAAEADQVLYDVDLNRRLVLVVGAEGRGLRRLVSEKCDQLLSIPQRGRIGSLNASVAAAAAMFEFVRQTRGKY